ncbi:MAG TPA: hypothetical protein GXZ48_04035 [Acholeplasmataceae bacterium]|jgi:tRNA nucleotidyltransferase (CCA-adding enzyme)|nr:hypothetical protein [Acholeplasmataceae bacterium]
MEEYLNKGKEILKLLVRNGFEGYIIGDAVRQSIMSLPYNEIEINTSATPDALKGIFEFTKVEPFNENMLKIKYYGYDFYISTFRLNKHKDRKAPSQIHYSKNLNDDLACRDFTINTIAMSPSGKIIDTYGGYDDIKKGIIRPIGKPKTMFADDPIQMLRAIRLVSELNFKLTNNIKKGIKRRKKFLLDADPKDINWELSKLFKGKYYSKALNLLIDLNLYKFVPGLRKAFALQKKNYSRFKKLTTEEFIISSFVINEEINEKYVPLAEENKNYNLIYDLCLANPKSKYTRFELYDNGLEVSLSANLISWALKRAPKKTRKISAEYQNLVIHSESDLEFKRSHVEEIVSGDYVEFIDPIMQQVIYKVLNQELANDYDVIEAFVVRRLHELKIDVDTKEEYEYRKEIVDNPITIDNDELVNATSEEEVAESLKRHGEIIKDYTQHRLDMLERRLNEQERLLKEKDLQLARLEYETRHKQITKDVESLVSKNIEMLKEMNYLGNTQEDKLELSKRLQQVYLDFIREIDNKYGLNEVNNEKD